jgi:DNA-binding transcriptional LysR family regulator
MQQPPLSQQIKAIERELDVQLFRRKARGVELTAAGRALLDDCRAILANLDHAVETARRTARGEQGRIRVGVTPTSPFHPFVPRVIRAFCEAFPQVSLALEECISNELVERLQNEKMDAAFVRVSVADPEGLVSYSLLEEPMVIAAPTRRVQAWKTKGDDAVSLKALAGETFLGYGRSYGAAPNGTAMYDTMIAACHAAGFSPRFGQQADRLASALNFVAAGLGICLVPASVQRMNLDGVTYRRIKGAVRPKATLSLAVRGSDSSPVLRQFVNLVRRAAKDFSEHGD